MNGRVLGIGALVVVGPVAVYYAIPLFLAIISLGEICPYSPAGIDLCTKPASTTESRRPPARRTSPELCRKPGIRYSGTTAEGAEVCFTLTPDRSKWVEIGFRFVRASGCPHTTGAAHATGETYYEGHDPLTGPGQITARGFTATIRGVRASGVLEDSNVCRGKSFRWSARRVS